LGELLKNDNKCCVCGDLFHPNWWTNFGFHERDENLRTQAKIMRLDELHDQLKRILQEELGLSFMFGEFHISLLN
jgi:hypothetical protein